jgi:fructose-1,6-bisphosphatase/sedoheptulose 1,7-bisphosphatase-like protein
MRFELVDRPGRQHATTAPAMNKIATGVEAKDFIYISAPVAENLKGIARAKKKTIPEITVVVLAGC